MKSSASPVRLLSTALTLVAAALASGCSAASSEGGTVGGPGPIADSGSPADVAVDTGIVVPEDAGTSACDVDAAGSIQFVSAAEVKGTPCAICVAQSCAVAQCECMTDPDQVSQGGVAVPACSVYASCLFTTFMAALASAPDAAFQDVRGAEATCKAAGSYAPATIAAGQALLGCTTSACASQCGGPM
jgi:hypothetical protein